MKPYLPYTPPDDIHQAVDDLLNFRAHSWEHKPVAEELGRKISSALTSAFGMHATIYAYWDRIAPGDDYTCYVDGALLELHEKFGDDVLNLLRAKARLLQ